MTVPTIWAPAKRALDAGVTEFAEIYFAISKTTDGGLQAESDTDADIIGALVRASSTGTFPLKAARLSLRWVYETTSRQRGGGVDLGAPFTRPEKHPDHGSGLRRSKYIALSRSRARRSAAGGAG